jgi:subtilisin family serine protease
MPHSVFVAAGRRLAAAVFGSTLALAVVVAPAAAQIRTHMGPGNMGPGHPGMGSRGMGNMGMGSRADPTGPRMEPQGSYRPRFTPMLRVPPIGFGPVLGPAVVEPDVVVRTNPGGGGKPPGRTTHKGSGGGKKPSPVARRPSGVPPSGERRYVPDEVVIEIAGSPAEATLRTLSARHRLVRIESRSLSLSGSTFFRWRIPDRRAVPAVVRALEADRAVRAAQPNYVYELSQQEPAPAASAAGSAGDPAQYALAKLRLPEAHGIATGDSVTVAVIDTGVDAAHPELDGVVAASFDALETTDGPDQHGTGIAGIIAAHARLMGTAPKVKILAVRAFAAGKGSTFSVVKGLDWAVSQNARVINMSFAGPSDPLFARTLSAARGKGAILVAAAGNGGAKAKPLYPAADRGVIAVTATDADDKLFAMANRGAHIAVAAPGVDILMPAPGSGYWVSTGTSMAAAHVSGVAALILERWPRLDGEALRKLLASTARDLGPKGRDDEFGAGLIDAYQAVTALGARTSEAAPANTKR